jgi:hypothetical protein
MQCTKRRYFVRRSIHLENAVTSDTDLHVFPLAQKNKTGERSAEILSHIVVRNKLTFFFLFLNLTTKDVIP